MMDGLSKDMWGIVQSPESSIRAESLRICAVLSELTGASSTGCFLIAGNGESLLVGSAGPSTFPRRLPTGWTTGNSRLALVADLQTSPPCQGEEFGADWPASNTLLAVEVDRSNHGGYWLWLLSNVLPIQIDPKLQLAARAVVDGFAREARALAMSESTMARAARFERDATHSESLYGALVESLPQNVFRKDLGGRFTFANSQMLESLGMSLEELVGKTDSDLYPEEIAKKYRDDDRRVVETRSPLDQVESHPDGKGGLTHVRVIKAPILDSKGVVSGIQGIYWDETERHVMQQRLRREHQLLRAMMDHVPDSVYFKDLDSRFIMVSQSLATKMGLNNPSEAVGKTDHDFFQPSHADESFADERRIIASGEPMRDKTELEVWRDGRERWVLTSKLPLTGEDGCILGTLGVSKDITDLKAVEAELEHARDQALASVRLKSEFLANMSHEIRTPLNAVVGMTGLLLETDLNDDQRDFAETIRKSADSLLGIINDILDFSKIEAGKLSIEHIVFDLHETIENTVELLGEAARKKQIELLCWIHEGVPRMVNGDPGRIRQVLVNLVGNAVKFTSEGEVVIEIGAQPAKKAQAEVSFQVRDTGIGIPPEARARLFQPFSQADGSTTRKFGGTGLGLAISRQLIELMGGQIGVESSVGAGSTFWFKIRLDNLDATVQPPPTKPTVEALEGKRVLIVDDNETNRKILRHQIGGWGMETHEASTSEGALHSLRVLNGMGKSVNAVILDFQMPSMDGFQLADAIGKLALQMPPSLLLLSSSCLVSPRQAAEHGIQTVLTKPVKKLRLHEALAQALGKSAPTPAGRLRDSAWTALKAADAVFKPSKTRVLVAEDNAVNQKVALMQLSKLGYKADAVASGKEVVEAVARLPYDIILMDCQMPDMDGYEATRQIRAMEALHIDPRHPRGIYIIALTASAFAEDRKKCLEVGMNDYLSKPVQVAGLKEALDRGVDFLGDLPDRVSSGDTGYFSLSSPAVNTTALQALRSKSRESGEAAVLGARIDQFMQDTTAAIAGMELRHASKDAHGLADMALRLHDSASGLQCERLARAADEILEATKKGSVGPAELLSRIQREFNRVKPLLARIKEEVSNHPESR